MKSDALFQLGMGPAVRDSTQTEDISRVRAPMTRDAGFRAPFHGMPPFPARVFAPRLAGRLRGNSAKALIGPA